MMSTNPTACRISLTTLIFWLSTSKALHKSFDIAALTPPYQYLLNGTHGGDRIDMRAPPIAIADDGEDFAVGPRQGSRRHRAGRRRAQARQGMAFHHAERLPCGIVEQQHHALMAVKSEFRRVRRQADDLQAEAPDPGMVPGINPILVAGLTFSTARCGEPTWPAE